MSIPRSASPSCPSRSTSSPAPRSAWPGRPRIAAVDAADLQPGQTILVAGATGGVGNQVVQLAAQSGAHVVATASSRAEQALVRDLGAATSVDYAGDVAQAVQQALPSGVDVVIHLAGDPATLLPAVRTGGRFVSTLIGSPEQLPTEEATVIGVYANPDAATLNRAASHRSTASPGSRSKTPSPSTRRRPRSQPSPAAPSASSSSPRPDPPEPPPGEPMQITVFGATGPAGRLVVRRALEQGTRSPPAPATLPSSTSAPD